MLRATDTPILGNSHSEGHIWALGMGSTCNLQMGSTCNLLVLAACTCNQPERAYRSGCFRGLVAWLEEGVTHLLVSLVALS